MNHDQIFAGLFLAALGIVLALWFGSHGLFFGTVLVVAGVLIAISGLKP